MVGGGPGAAQVRRPERASAEAAGPGSTAGSQSATLAALAFPAVGLSYYRLRATRVRPDGNSLVDGASVSSLVTHHAGVTLVQSLTNSIAVATTLKFVRGIAASGVVLERPSRSTELPADVKYSASIGSGGGSHSIGGVAHW